MRTAAMRTITLTDGAAEVVIVPALGAGLASYDLVSDGRRESLFRPCRDLTRATPFDLASNLLVPWSNRISGGGFQFGGRFYPLQPNLDGEPTPIHGNGFSSTWAVVEATAATATLAFDSDGPGSFMFAAEVCYALEAGTLRVAAKVTNRGRDKLPFGLGLHPWLPRTPGTTLQARATMVTLEDALHLPAGQVPVASREDWDFSTPRRLPDGWINNDFSPWDGQAEIVWTDRRLRLRIEAGRALSAYIVYSPAFDADFFCFEPVTHLVNAHNRSGGPEANGLVLLDSGDDLATACRFVPARL
jgi:aldose 1-epimerase